MIVSPDLYACQLQDYRIVTRAKMHATNSARGISVSIWNFTDMSLLVSGSP
jgi:hypothetical protein